MINTIPGTLTPSAHIWISTRPEDKNPVRLIKHHKESNHPYLNGYFEYKGEEWGDSYNSSNFVPPSQVAFSREAWIPLRVKYLWVMVEQNREQNLRMQDEIIALQD